MSRVVIAWELGSNLGHAVRMLSIASRLKKRGHSPLLVTRDLTLTAKVFAGSGIPYIQAPAATMFANPGRQAASYAEVLWNQGWADRTQLWALVQGWANLFRMFRPHIAVMDHSPTALLAARVTGTPSVAIGTGFEVPPDEAPIPGFASSAVGTARILESERRVLEHANWVLDALKLPTMNALRDLFAVDKRYLATFAELDHYGPRADGNYVGPIGDLGGGERVDWPASSDRRIFAYLRAGNEANNAILGALRSTGASVIGFIPGAPPATIDNFASDNFKISTRPILFSGLFESADVCVSYAPAGTVTLALLKGVPQLMIPRYPEAQLTAMRVEAMGAGLTIDEPSSESQISQPLQRLLEGAPFKSAAGKFADSHRSCVPTSATDHVVDEIERLGSQSEVHTRVGRQSNANA